MKVFSYIIMCYRDEKAYLLDDTPTLILAISEKDAISQVTLNNSAELEMRKSECKKDNNKFSFEVIVRPF